MININKSEVKVTGSATTIIAEYATLTKALNESLSDTLGKEEAEELLNRSYELAFMSDDELDSLQKETQKKYGTSIPKAFIKDALNGNGKRS